MLWGPKFCACMSVLNCSNKIGMSIRFKQFHSLLWRSFRHLVQYIINAHFQPKRLYGFADDVHVFRWVWSQPICGPALHSRYSLDQPDLLCHLWIILYYLTCKAEYHELSRPMQVLHKCHRHECDMLPWQWVIFCLTGLITFVICLYPWLLLCYVPWGGVR